MKRCHIPKQFKIKLLLKQKGYCIYCGQFFGEMAWYKNKPVVLRIEVEHVVPYNMNKEETVDNFVLACNICNMVKRDKVFSSFAETIAFIKNKWDKYGTMTMNRRRVSSNRKLEALYKINSGQHERLNRREVATIRHTLEAAKTKLAELLDNPPEFELEE